MYAYLSSAGESILVVYMCFLVFFFHCHCCEHPESLLGRIERIERFKVLLIMTLISVTYLSVIEDFHRSGNDLNYLV